MKTWWENDNIGFVPHDRPGNSLKRPGKIWKSRGIFGGDLSGNPEQPCLGK